MSRHSNGSGAGGAGGRTLRVKLDARRRAELVSGMRRLAERSSPGREIGRAGPGPSELSGFPARPEGPADAAEWCELCGAGLPTDHRHLIHLDERRLLCACETCWSVRSGEPRFRPAGVRTEWLDDFELPDDAWASFGIPIGLAFFMRTGEPERAVAFYPSPAGATESEIGQSSWERIRAMNPALERLEPDSEALIVNRIGEPHQHAIAPIDDCYRLVGMIKASWEGISGGEGPELAIARFFAELRVRGLTSRAANANG